jgi:transposase InsO family protein
MKTPRDPSRHPGERRRPALHPTAPTSTNDEVERFDRTLLGELGLCSPCLSNQKRSEALTAWLHIYTHDRGHATLGQLRPVSRPNNVSGDYS